VSCEYVASTQERGREDGQVRVGGYSRGVEDETRHSLVVLECLVCVFKVSDEARCDGRQRELPTDDN